MLTDKLTPLDFSGVLFYIPLEVLLTKATDDPAECRIYISFLITEFWKLCEQMFKIIIRSQIIELCCFR